MQPKNPFFIVGYYGPEYFCDRVAETQMIVDALDNSRNITLIAPRRIGKTGLIKNVFHTLSQQQEDVITIYIDIYATRSFEDFVQLMANSILGKLDNSLQKILDRVNKFIKSCRINISIDDNGKPRINLDIQAGQQAATLKEIFDYLSSSDKRCYIAIDEFQQIAEYKDQTVEALLRSYIQFTPNVNFIFSGSKQHVMQQMFLTAKRPFYQSSQTVTIGVIKEDLYYNFANNFFLSSGFELKQEVFNYIYTRFQGHTWYVQSVLNRLYSYHSEVDVELVDYVIDMIVKENAYSYSHLLSVYTDNNIALLKAIANEGVVLEITSSEFIHKYSLKAASSVNTSLNKLIAEELVYKSDVGYIVYDRFMNLWLSKQQF